VHERELTDLCFLGRTVRGGTLMNLRLSHGALGALLLASCADETEGPRELAQLAALPPVQCEPADTSGDFYAWDGTLPAEDGAVIKCRAISKQADRPQGYRVLYRTTLVQHEASGDVVLPVPASGVVWIPEGAQANRPVIANTHGAVGILAECGPSRSTGYDRTYVNELAKSLPSQPIVVVPDYVGLGVDAKLRVPEVRDFSVVWPNGVRSWPFSDVSHPFASLEGEGRATIDLVRAARQLPDANLEVVKWVAFGQSQGGHAALATAEVMARDYAPELELLGVVAGAPATQLYEDRNWNPVLKNAVFGMMAATLPLEWRTLRSSRYLTYEGAMLVGNSANSTCFDDDSLFDVLVSYNAVKLFRDDNNPFRDPAVVSALTANSPGKQQTNVPIFVGQVRTDPLVMYQRTRAFLASADSEYKKQVTLCEYYGGGARNDFEQRAYEALGWAFHTQDHNAFGKMFANTSRRIRCERDGRAVAATPNEFVSSLAW
jgi:pimeloyl-ACP methyl ester carboxylesterase